MKEGIPSHSHPLAPAQSRSRFELDRYLLLAVMPPAAGGAVLLISGGHPNFQTWPVFFSVMAGVGLGLILILGRRLERLMADKSRLTRLERTRSEELRKVNGDLTRALREARAATQARSAFLAHMSHEIRTPLHGILGLSEMLREEVEGIEEKEHARALHRCGQGLLEMVNEVLDFSKVEAGQIELETIPFDLRDEVTTLLSTYAAPTGKSSLQVTATVASSVPTSLVGDPLRLRQVLGNLLSNAIKFTESGSVHLRVEAEKVSPIRALIRFEVEDTGIGFNAQEKERLFLPFTQADASMSRRFGGTGLGLSTSHRLVERMGGRLDAVSTPGVGSCFSFALSFGMHSAIPAPFSQGNPQLQGRVLLVEDDAVNRTVAARMLESLGLKVGLATGGKHALRLFALGGWDLILMDCRMPDLDGYETVRRLRSQEKSSSHIPILALTAHGTLEDEMECRAAGMDGYLTKPIRCEVLVSALAEHLPTRERRVAR